MLGFRTLDIRMFAHHPHSGGMHYTNPPFAGSTYQAETHTSIGQKLYVAANKN